MPFSGRVVMQHRRIVLATLLVLLDVSLAAELQISGCSLEVLPGLNSITTDCLVNGVNVTELAMRLEAVEAILQTQFPPAPPPPSVPPSIPPSPPSPPSLPPISPSTPPLPPSLPPSWPPATVHTTWAGGDSCGALFSPALVSSSLSSGPGATITFWYRHKSMTSKDGVGAISFYEQGSDGNHHSTTSRFLIFRGYNSNFYPWYHSTGEMPSSVLLAVVIHGDVCGSSNHWQMYYVDEALGGGGMGNASTSPGGRTNMPSGSDTNFCAMPHLRFNRHCYGTAPHSSCVSRDCIDVDDLRAYDTPLSPDELEQIFVNGKS